VPGVGNLTRFGVSIRTSVAVEAINVVLSNNCAQSLESLVWLKAAKHNDYCASNQRISFIMFRTDAILSAKERDETISLKRYLNNEVDPKPT
jgi:uncharacterized membrane protein YheB (UPF0754 family)